MGLGAFVSLTVIVAAAIAAAAGYLADATVPEDGDDAPATGASSRRT